MNKNYLFVSLVFYSLCLFLWWSLHPHFKGVCSGGRLGIDFFHI